MNIINVLNRARIMIIDLLEIHRADINQAYLEADGELSIGLTVKMKPTKNPQKLVLSVDLSFVSRRIKDGKAIEVDDSQAALFDAIEKMRPKKGEGIDSVTISSSETGDSVTLTAKD